MSAQQKSNESVWPVIAHSCYTSSPSCTPDQGARQSSAPPLTGSLRLKGEGRTSRTRPVKPRLCLWPPFSGVGPFLRTHPEKLRPTATA